MKTPTVSTRERKAPKVRSQTVLMTDWLEITTEEMREDYDSNTEW